MLKAIIADDEKWICQMIGKIINWDEIGIELVGQAEDGIEAFSLIKSLKPDIVITDIRMPGMDGIELVKKTREMQQKCHFIIISGFRQFEYAHNAIKYGVDDYLLKPIKKVELTSILTKIRSEFDEIKVKKNEEKKIENKLIQNTEILRKQFLNKLILANNENHYDLETINNEYQLGFQDGLFQSFIIRLDKKNNEIDDYEKKCKEKFFIVVTRNLKDFCWEIQTTDDICIINYPSQNINSIKKAVNNTMPEFEQYLKTLDIFDVTIGLGTQETSLDNIVNSVNSAKKAIMCRIVAGVNKIISYSPQDYEKYSSSDFVTENDERQIINIIEVLDAEGLNDYISRLFYDLRTKNRIDPCLYFEIAEKITDIYINAIKKNRATEKGINKNDIISDFTGCKNINDIINKLSKNLVKDLKDYSKIIDKQNYAPIRIAKKYISKNYNKTISLNEIAQIVNMNSVYFSHLFKKETGQNFSDYIINYRMNIAKELLKNIKYNVSQVSHMVGYQDEKYFSKLFKKQIGINPKDFRKIHL